jgi:hypothetical protein
LAFDHLSPGVSGRPRPKELEPKDLEIYFVEVSREAGTDAKAFPRRSCSRELLSGGMSEVDTPHS